MLTLYTTPVIYVALQRRIRWRKHSLPASSLRAS
jgi:hypothetical protein